MNDILAWIGIAACLTQSAMFSGLNLAVFSLSRLDLELEVERGNSAARSVLELRRDSSLILTTILWGNVGINVLLTLLSDSVLAGVAAFAFSTILITICGEIAPQAYFSRNALKMASLLAPVLRLYRFVLYPVAKPLALLLDAWLGEEKVRYYGEDELKGLIVQHVKADESDVDRVEAVGALNFLTIDDLPIEAEGVPLDPDSILELPVEGRRPAFPPFSGSAEDPFLREVERSGRPWVVITDARREPRVVLDVDGFLRHALFHPKETDPLAFCHRPIIVRDRKRTLGDVVSRLRMDPEADDDQVISHDVILLWDDHPRVLTGADLLGRLMLGIAKEHGR